MLVFASTELIQKQELNLQNPSEISACFDRIGHDKIIDLGNHLYLTYRQFAENKPPVNLCVAYGPDMFLLSTDNVIQYDYAIATDPDGNAKAVIKFLGTTYLHNYIYTGGLDLTFLNQYDCIYLCGCNEFSVELCQVALKYWTGKRLVLVGNDWNDLVEYLPDLPGIECFYDFDMDKFTLYELSVGMNPLYIKVGMPHQELLERYENGIMYYDEVMALTYLFSDYREFGEENPDKNFFVLDIAYDNLGLFTIFNKANDIFRYIKSKNMIPVMHMTKSNGSMYSDHPGDEIWNKFYCQPEGHSLKDILNSKHVYFAPFFYNGSVLCHIMDQYSQGISVTWPNGIYNQQVMSLLHEKQKEFLPFPEDTLGVLARGTDYAKIKLVNHCLHAPLDMIIQKIDETLSEKPYLKYIYVATEDAAYCQKLKERYAEKLYCTDQNRFQTENYELLAEMHRNTSQKIDGYILGTDYILSIYLLAQCRALIASGGCMGYTQVLKENNGKWSPEDIYLFDLGVTSS